MGEADLTEIEGRLDLYPPQARQDILRLTGELRRLSQSPESRKKTAASPLYDALTGLLNAGAYGVRFAMARARATRYHKIFAVMSVDLDFEGQAPADAADREGTVQAVAERLGCCVRATDTLARIGEESFAIILEDLTQPGHAERVQQNVKDALAQPMHVGIEERIPLTRVQLRFYPVAEHDKPLH